MSTLPELHCTDLKDTTLNGIRVDLITSCCSRKDPVGTYKPYMYSHNREISRNQA